MPSDVSRSRAVAGGLDRRTMLAGSLAASLATAPALAALGDELRLGRIASDAGLLFGFALDPRQLASDPAYAAFVTRQASIVVPENALKWQAVHPTENRFVFTDADAIAGFARRNDIRLRGHTLCWHRGLPDWVERTVTRANAEAVLTAHIRTVVGRYRGGMQSWDVVNEAIAPEDGQAGGWRTGFWWRTLGPAFLDIAFRAAHASDPDAVLCYNEYGLELDGERGQAKRAAVLALLRGARSRGVPIGALGIQSHLRAGGRASFGSALAGFLREVRALGLAVTITELDVDDSALDPAAADGVVADIYKRYLDLVLGTGTVSSVLSWGVWDWPHRVGATPAQSDTTARRPLIFAPGGSAKPATWAVAHCFERATRPG